MQSKLGKNAVHGLNIFACQSFSQTPQQLLLPEGQGVVFPPEPACDTDTAIAAPDRFDWVCTGKRLQVISDRAFGNPKLSSKGRGRFMAAAAQEIQDRAPPFIWPHPTSPPAPLCCLEYKG